MISIGKIALVDSFSKEQFQQIVQESFSMKEVIQKLGYGTCNGSNAITVKKRIQKYNISTEHFQSQSPTKRTRENVFIKNATCNQSTLRRWYIKESNIEYKCKICGQPPIWQGKELTLTLDHIDGDNRNNVLENLRWVCPNCDRQLDTFGFKRGAK